MSTDVKLRPQTWGRDIAIGQRWFLAGLFLTTLATLGLEMLDTRLLSVMAWYHLSFFAVSTAMLGMSAAAVHVFVAGERFEGQVARDALSRFAWLFALSIPLSHIGTLCISLKFDPSLTGLCLFAFFTLIIGVPFYLAGLLVTIALTRVGGRIGLTYAIDLLGASLGSLAVIALLTRLNISSAFFALGGLAAGGAYCFQRYAGERQSRALWLGAALLVVAVLNSQTTYGFRVFLSKHEPVPSYRVTYDRWNTHSQVIMSKQYASKPFYWGAKPPADLPEVRLCNLVIDGEAATPVTEWDGERKSLSWVKYDVTSLPYHLRKGAEVAIIGAGGGRDILAAIWGEAKDVTGIELNNLIYSLIQGPLRQFTKIADRPEVHLVNDEARSYLTHHERQYDIVQMSLVDTWAATGAGAFTLSENGLNTREAWTVFLNALKPGGIFSVSRWHTPADLSQSSRMLALATSVLLDRGVADPSDHIALVVCDQVADLVISTAPMTKSDLDRLEEAARLYGFQIIVAPGHKQASPFFAKIVSSKSPLALTENYQDRYCDYSPPSDDRPYFFNFTKLSTLSQLADPTTRPAVLELVRHSNMIQGNVVALATLTLLGGTATLLIVALILVPLLISGLPQMDRASFVFAVSYFALIGLGFMFVQIPYMQRFSVYLGHPAYAIAVILFSMIFFTGLGSFASDRIAIESQPSMLVAIPVAIAAAILIVGLAIQPVIDRTVHFDLVARCAIVTALAAPVAFLLGLCFPIGMRLVGRISEGATAWMWGVNGACGVLASVIAVVLSIHVGIHMSLYVAATLYLLLIVPAFALWRRGLAPA